MAEPIECEVYKSTTKENYYVYVVAGEGLAQVPEALLAQLGEVEVALTFSLTEDRALATENPAKVIRNLEAQGYHLQLPPADDKVTSPRV